MQPIYLQLAHAFADLHDTPGRMLAKKCISRVVPWAEARAFFYFRLRRRLAELSLCRRLVRDSPTLSIPDALALLRRWFDESLKPADCVWSADRYVLEWLANNHSLLETNIANLRRAAISEKVRTMGMSEPTAVVRGVMALVNCLPSDQREATVAALRRGILFSDPHAVHSHPGLDDSGGSHAMWDDEDWDGVHSHADDDDFFNRPSRSGSMASGGGGNTGGGGAMWF